MTLEDNQGNKVRVKICDHCYCVCKASATHCDTCEEPFKKRARTKKPTYNEGDYTPEELRQVKSKLRSKKSKL